MFLDELNEKESISFINVVKNFALVDNVFAEQEKELIENYIEELHLEGKDLSSTNLEEGIKVLESSTDKIKRIVLFELAGLALIDGEFEDKEIKFIANLSDRLGVSRARVQAFFNYMVNLFEVYKFTTVDSESKLELLKEEAEELLK